MKLIIITILLFLSNSMFSQDLDDFFVETNGTVYDIDSDSNYIYFAGKFNEVMKYSGSGVVFSTNSTKIDYKNKYKIYGTVNDAVPDGNGGWFICGDFTRIGESFVGGIAHINQDGSLDENIKINLITQSSNYSKIKFDDKFIYVLDGVRLYKYDFKSNNFSRVNFSERINDFALDDNYIYISSEVELMENYQYKSSIYSTKRLFKQNEEVDSTFQIKPFNYGYLNNPRIIKLHNNYLYFLNDFSIVSRININSIKIDDNWKLYIDGPRISIYDIKFDNDYIFIAGEFAKINNQEVNNFAKINISTLEINKNWVKTELGTVSTFDIDNNNIYLNHHRFESLELAKINKLNGNIDSNFNYFNKENYSGEFNIISLSNDKLFLGGNFSTFNEGYSLTNLFRFDIKENKVDNNFNINLNYYNVIKYIKIIDDYLFLSDNRDFIMKYNLKKNLLEETLIPNYKAYSIESDNEFIYIGGDFKTNESFKNLFRFNKHTNEIDLNWSPNPNGIVESLKIDGDNLYVGGKFDTIYNQSKVYLAKLDLVNSILDNDFDLGFIFNSKYKTVNYKNFGVNLIEIKDDLIYVNVQSETKENVKISGLVEINNINLNKRYLNSSIPAMNIVDLVFKDGNCFAVDYVYVKQYLKYENLFKIDLENFQIDTKWYCDIKDEGDYTPRLNFVGKYLYYSTSGKISNYNKFNLFRFNDKDISLKKPELLFPENNSNNIYAFSKLITKSVKNADRYYTVYSLEEDFKYLNNANANKQGFGFSLITTPSTTVYWKTQVRNEFTTSEWSDVFTFKTRFVAPKILNSVLEDTLYLNYDSDFIEWEDFGDNFKYFITADEDNELKNRYIDSISTDDYKFIASNFKDSTNYHFKVYAHESDSISEPSSIYVKTLLKKTPSSPLKIFPENTQHLSKVDLKLYWKNTRDVEINHLQLSKDPLFKSFIIDDDSIKVYKILADDVMETKSYDLENLDSNTTYYWRVKGINKLGESEFSDTWKFTTMSSTSNVEDSKDNLISIYPNPANSILNIESNNQYINIDKIEILDLNGKSFLKQDVFKSKIDLDIRFLPTGTYLIKIESQNENKTFKFIKN